MVNRQLGIRRSYINEIAAHGAGIYRARAADTGIRQQPAGHGNSGHLPEGRVRNGRCRTEAVRGYRGGYLPRERREIERACAPGEIRAVVATNALELGIDIGSLDAVVMAGYPGTIASTWQRAGRAGRRQTRICSRCMVASSAPLDQYMVEHPEYFFGRSPEHAYINPDNLEILLGHLKCAAFELPLREGEKFGAARHHGSVRVSGGVRLAAPFRRRVALDFGYLSGRCREPALGFER